MLMLTRSMLQSIKAIKHSATMVQRRFHVGCSVLACVEQFVQHSGKTNGTSNGHRS